MIIDDLISYGKKVKQAGLITGNSGNISVRLDNNRFAISPSGTRLDELDNDPMAICSLHNENPLQGRPSIEAGMHRAVYNSRPGVGAILHFQSLYATIVACSKETAIDLNFIPEVPACIGTINIVHYFPPGSDELARAVEKAAADPTCYILMLKKHGQVAVGKDLDEAMKIAEFCEFACKIFCIGKDLERYTDEELKGLAQYRKK